MHVILIFLIGRPFSYKWKVWNCTDTSGSWETRSYISQSKASVETRNQSWLSSCDLCHLPWHDSQKSRS